MTSVLFLLVLVIVVAGAVTAVTITVLHARSPRPPLPPASQAGWQGSPDLPGPQFPLYNPTHHLSPGNRERILVLLRSGKKIHAVKLYREVTGAGLREAKDAVDYLERFR